MAHVNKRRTQSGELRYDVRYRGPDDRERSRSFRTRRDADRFRSSVEVNLAGQKWIDPNAGNVKLEEYATSWLSTRSTLKAQTRTTYEDQLRVHIIPHLGRLELGRLTPRHVREWHSKLIANGLSRNTAAKSYRMLRTILSTAVEDDLIARNRCQTRRGCARPRPMRTAQIARSALVLRVRQIGCRFRGSSQRFVECL